MPNLRRACFVLQVKQDRLAGYKERHKAVWPERQAALRETGWRNDSLFVRDDGLLVGCCETPDFQGALDGMAARDVNARWQAEMKGFFLGPGGREADKQMVPLEEVLPPD